MVSGCSSNLNDPNHAVTGIDVKEVFQGIESVSAKDTVRVALRVRVILQRILNTVRGIRNRLLIRGSDPDTRKLISCRRFHNNRVSHP